MPRLAATLLAIPQPCHESWAVMTAAPGGRHCVACQKTVVDFTHQTDAEILAYLKRASGAGCGRFRADQLARPLLPAVPVSRWRSWLSAVLAVGGVLGAAGRAAGQTLEYGGGPEPVTTTRPAGTSGVTTTPVPPEILVPASQPILTSHKGADGLFTLRGVVTYSNDNSPLPGVTVALEGTHNATVTDSQGRFELSTNDNPTAQWLTLRTVGFTAKKIPAYNAAGAVPVIVQLQEEVMGQLKAPTPVPWHPRAMLNWARYQITRPFRQY